MKSTRAIFIKAFAVWALLLSSYMYGYSQRVAGKIRMPVISVNKTNEQVESGQPVETPTPATENAGKTSEEVKPVQFRQLRVISHHGKTAAHRGQRALVRRIIDMQRQKQVPVEENNH